MSGREREKQKLGIDLLSLFEESETILTRREEGRGRDCLTVPRHEQGEKEESSLGTSFLGRFFQHLAASSQTADDAAPYTRANPPKRMLVSM